MTPGFAADSDDRYVEHGSQWLLDPSSSVEAVIGKAEEALCLRGWDVCGTFVEPCEALSTHPGAKAC
jgi:hypothetical protein